ncbi:LOW QUALITY PROTEIN: hypothetical protein Nmel_001234 [Mimus melanotis]
MVRDLITNRPVESHHLGTWIHLAFPWMLECFGYLPDLCTLHYVLPRTTSSILLTALRQTCKGPLTQATFRDCQVPEDSSPHFSGSHLRDDWDLLRNISGDRSVDRRPPQ